MVNILEPAVYEQPYYAVTLELAGADAHDPPRPDHCTIRVPLGGEIIRVSMTPSLEVIFHVLSRVGELASDQRTFIITAPAVAQFIPIGYAIGQVFPITHQGSTIYALELRKI